MKNWRKIFAALGIALLVVMAGMPQQTYAVQRTVLMELMTATWCQFCPEAEDAMYNLAALYGPDSVACIEYHTTSYGDPYGTAETDARIAYYAPPGYPTMFFDGWDNIVGGGEPMEPYYQPIIVSHLADDASLSIYNTGFLIASGGEVTAHLNVSWVEYVPVRVRFMLIESGLVHNNRTYHYVCRDILPDEAIIISTPGQTFDITRVFSIQPGWNYTNMQVLTFVQYDGNKVVLNSAMGFDNPSQNVTVNLTPYNPPIVVPAQGGYFNYNIVLQNHETTEVAFDYWQMMQRYDGMWFGPVLGPVHLIRPAGATITRDRAQYIPGNYRPGNYTYYGYTGTFPSAVWHSDSFTFTKSTTFDGSSGVAELANVGEDFFTEELCFTPTQCNLAQNFPNPFNPTTAISYQLSTSSLVSLKVYDTTGRLTMTLVNGWRAAGHHEAVFDGSSLPSGVYVYRLEAGDFSATGKMMLLK